jgi:hypothetical protein
MVYRQTAQNKKNSTRLFCCAFFLLLPVKFLLAQAPVLRLTNSFTHQSVLYNTDTFNHTAWKPVLYTDSTYIKSNHSWLYRKFFEEHLLQVQEGRFNIFGDVVFDEYLGATNRAVPTEHLGVHGEKSKALYMNTRGYVFNGNIGRDFYFETDLYENQGRLPAYVDSFVRATNVIPFQSRFKNFKKKGFDFSYSTARLIYTPGQHFLFDLGYNTNFIGDGYRSLLLSDYNTPYPYFRTAVTFGKLQYSVMWSQYISQGKTDSTIYALGFPRKLGQTYLLDWQATKNFSVGIFNSVISSGESADHRKNIGVSFFSPIIFIHGSKSPSGIKSNDIAGLNLKFRITPEINVYGQMMVDELGSGEWQKRYGWQLGLRVGNLLKVDGLNAQAEFNTVRPYAYASDTVTTVYGHDNEALAHPQGANFKEAVFVADYSYKKWWFRVEAIATRYGADSSGTVDFGHDIFKPLYLHTREDNIRTDQGLNTKLYYGDVRIAYILNKKNNLRLEAGAVYRSESNKRYTFKDTYGYIGVRYTFRKLIYDF